jgi:phosphopantothenoylcysteine decarboxylase/phosphopantothenate--cysteine ligase
MGFAVAAAAREAGHRVTLVAGPVHLETPAGVKRIDVVSAREMLVACVEVFAEADAVIMTAAVADYRSRRRLAGKWRDKGSARIELVPNPDILAKLGRSKAADRGKKSTRTVIGFALETGSGRARALAKLHAKRADWIVLNDASALNAERSSATILAPDGSSLRIERRSKREIARALIALLE